MPRQTLGELFDKLQKEVADQHVELEVFKVLLGRDSPQTLSERVLILEAKVEELVKQRDSAGQRLFDVFKLVLAAALGAVAAYFLARK